MIWAREDCTVAPVAAAWRVFLDDRRAHGMNGARKFRRRTPSRMGIGLGEEGDLEPCEGD
jgi:hypothetical protein